jgi:hypothetical protein
MVHAESKIIISLRKSESVTYSVVSFPQFPNCYLKVKRITKQQLTTFAIEVLLSCCDEFLLRKSIFDHLHFILQWIVSKHSLSLFLQSTHTNTHTHTDTHTQTPRTQTQTHTHAHTHTHTHLTWQ